MMELWSADREILRQYPPENATARGIGIAKMVGKIIQILTGRGIEDIELQKFPFLEFISLYCCRG